MYLFYLMFLHSNSNNDEGSYFLGEKKKFVTAVFDGRYELNKLTSLPMCGFIGQLVEHRTGIAEVTGSSLVEALIFSGFFFPIA